MVERASGNRCLFDIDGNSRGMPKKQIKENQRNGKRKT